MSEDKFEDVTFTITVTMRRRWLGQFLSMLKHMQKLGGWGSSRMVSFFSDGDGDFRPKFEWDHDLLPELEPPVKEANDGETFWDAG